MNIPDMNVAIAIAIVRGIRFTTRSTRFGMKATTPDRISPIGVRLIAMTVHHVMQSVERRYR